MKSKGRNDISHRRRTIFSAVGRSHGVSSVMTRTSSCSKPRLARGTVRVVLTSIEDTSGTAKEVGHAICVLDALLQLEAGHWMKRIIDSNLDSGKQRAMLCFMLTITYNKCSPLPGGPEKGHRDWHLWVPDVLITQVKLLWRGWPYGCGKRWLKNTTR